MPRRLAALGLAAAVLLLAVPATVLAQGNDLLPPTAASPTPAATATPTPAPTPADTSTGSTTLFIIGAGLLVAFIAIGVWIARDARRALPTDHHRRRSSAEPLAADGAPRPRSPQAKQRARARGKAQRHARRHNRPR